MSSRGGFFWPESVRKESGQVRSQFRVLQNVVGDAARVHGGQNSKNLIIRARCN